LSDENPLKTQLNAMLQIGYNLHSLGQELDNSLIAIAMIISLPNSYSTLRSILMATDLKLTTRSIKSSILQEEQLCKSSNGSRALAAQIQKKTTKNQRGQTKAKRPAGGDKGEKDRTGPKKVCNYAGCGIQGHTDDECHKLKAVLEKYGNSKDKSNEPKSTSSNTIATNRAATFSNDYDNDSICLFTTRVQSQSPLVDTPIRLHATCHAPLSELHGWMVDSGATKPMSSQHDLFLSYQKLITPKPVRLGDDSIIYVGTVSLSFNLNESKHEGMIKDIYHIPDLQGNLLAVSALTKRGYKFVFDLDGCRITDAKGQITAFAHLRNDLFILDANLSIATACISILPTDSSIRTPKSPEQLYVAQTKKSTATLAVWHRRLGHTNKESVKKLEREGMVRGMEISNSTDEPDSPSFCTSCVYGKMTQTVIPKVTDAVQPRLLYRIDLDVCGPMRTTSHTGHRYFSTFTDGKSHFIIIYLQKTKDKTFAALKAYIA
jgi:hypothetical protein